MLRRQISPRKKARGMLARAPFSLTLILSRDCHVMRTKRSGEDEKIKMREKNEEFKLVREQ